MTHPSSAKGGANQLSQLAPGTRFGSYEIVQTLGTGTFGAVYEALRLPLMRRVALKVLHERLVHDDEVMQRFMREARAGAQFQHPYIVDTQDIGEVDGVPFIAMEFLDGETLGQRLKREGRFSCAEALDVMLPILSAVAAIHEQGVVHRDLKPGNLFLARALQGTCPKLLDFGIAKLHDTVAEVDGPLTQTAALLGTPPYMSPEQARQSRDVDARSDQWALGAILYECLTGQRAFQGASVLEVLTHVTSGPVVPLRALAPDVPEAVEAAVMRALDRDVVRRFSSVRSMGRALVAFAGPATRLALDGEFATREATRGVTRESEVPVVHLHETLRATPPVSVAPVQVATTMPTPTRSGGRRGAWMALVVVTVAASISAAALLRARPATPTTHDTPPTPSQPEVVAPPPPPPPTEEPEAVRDEAPEAGVDAAVAVRVAPSVRVRVGVRPHPSVRAIGNF